MKVELLESMGDDLSIVNAARVSFNKQKDVFEEADKKLIRYLAKHGHWTPLSQVQVKLRIELPVFLARQYFKHIVGSVKNEVSRRYVDSEPEFWIPSEWRSRPDKSIKQGSGEALSLDKQEFCLSLYERALDRCKSVYTTLLELGVCPEQARAVLPQAMMTTVIDSGTLVYWARVYNQRIDTHAQKEWVPLVEQINDAMMKVAPVSWQELTTKRQ